MNQKGITIIELLIVIVVIGLISAFGVVAVGNIIENTREDSFVNTANTMVSAATNAYNQNDDLWNDNVATMQELKDAEYLDVDDDDPWGRPYDTTNSYVVVEQVINRQSPALYLSAYMSLNLDYLFKVKLVSETATIGFDNPLEDFDGTDVVYLISSSNVINGIIETITGSSNGSISGDNDNDSITVENNAGSNTEINTFAGNDVVNIGNDMQGRAEINTGSGNDTVTVTRDIKQNSVVNTGDGDDTINLDRWLRGRSIIDAGSGNDTVTIGEIRYHTQTRLGDGDDILVVNSVLGNFRGSVDMGAGDDTATITDTPNPFSGVSGSFNGGAGNDTLNLPTVDSARWAQISNLFSGWETVNLSDTTITP